MSISSLGRWLVLLALLVINATPIPWIPPFRILRVWFFELLTSPATIAVDPDPSVRPCGLRIWDDFHPFTSMLAIALAPIGLPILMWAVLSLGDAWTGDLNEKRAAAQIITAMVLGGVAFDAFIFFQLPRVMRPNLSIRFLEQMGKDDPRSQGEVTSSIPVKQLTCVACQRANDPGRGKVIHIRITNVETRHNTPLKVSIRCSKDLIGSISLSDGGLALKSTRITIQPLSHPHAHRWNSDQREVQFEPISDPGETGSGASVVLSFYLARAPETSEAVNVPIHVIVTSGEAGAGVSKTLRLTFRDGAVSQPPTS